MRLVYMGSPEEVIAPLKVLLADAKHQVVAVVSQPAKPMGRKSIPQDPPLAVFAKQVGLNVLQPEKASHPDFLETLKELRPDVIITAAYGQILTDAFLAIPRRGTINIHPSLLPAYRGAIPVPAALLDGLEETGVTILFTVKKLDAGAVICQERAAIEPNEKASELTDRMFRLGGEILPKALQLLEDENFKGIEQDETKVTLCRKIQKNDGQVRWASSNKEIINRFRAYHPWPGTFSFFGGQRIVFEAMTLASQDKSLRPGECEYLKPDKTLLVGTGEGCICIQALKPAGGKSLDAASFWNGLKQRDTSVFFTDATIEGDR